MSHILVTGNRMLLISLFHLPDWLLSSATTSFWLLLVADWLTASALVNGGGGVSPGVVGGVLVAPVTGLSAVLVTAVMGRCGLSMDTERVCT